MKEFDYGTISDIVKHFLTSDSEMKISECKNGHINSTYFIELDGEKYVLQRINTGIFADYDGLMKNIVAVTGFLRDKYRREGYADYMRRTLNCLYTSDGLPYCVTDFGVWRMYDFIRGARSYQTVESEDMFCDVGAAFGKFQKDLLEFDPAGLIEILHDFHNTVVRYEKFSKACQEDRAGRLCKVKDEVNFVTARRDLCNYIVSRIADGTYPLRVTHNDTKLNNIMMDEKTGECVCIIDLDTVTPGSVLYDFGDSIRFGASSAAEDETDLSGVFMREEMFEAYTKGFLGVLGDSLTDDEISGLPMAAIVITFESGMRFLTDYLEGDVYFRTEYPEHNIDRAKNQFKLVEDMERKLAFMNSTVEKYRK